MPKWACKFSKVRQRWPQGRKSRINMRFNVLIILSSFIMLKWTFPLRVMIANVWYLAPNVKYKYQVFIFNFEFVICNLLNIFNQNRNFLRLKVLEKNWKMEKLKLSDDVMPNSKYKRDRRNAMLETVSSKESSTWP